MKSLEKIVEIKPLTIEGLFPSGTMGFCIPTYQRHFSWDRNNFNRFLDDIAHDMLEDEPFTFLGSIICYECSGESRSALGEEPPHSVYTVVDGQQRMSLLAALAILLRSQIDQEWNAAKGSSKKWFEPEVKNTRAMLKDIIAISGRERADYPRIIRADRDRWNLEPQEGYYKSPIARLICSYLNYISSHDDSSQFDHNDVRNTRTFKSLIKTLHELLGDFCRDEKSKYNLANLTDGDTMRPVWKQGEQAPAIKDLTEIERPLFKSLLLANYLCKRLYVARVEIRGAPERSFAIFERLNMTGASLNAFEAFKPYVVRELGEEYKGVGCEQRNNIERIEAGYVEIENREKSDKHVAELITSMALAYSGDKLGLATHTQYEHLRKYAYSGQNEDSKERKDGYKKFLHCFRTVSDMKMMFKAKKDGVTDFLDGGSGLEIPDSREMAKDMDEATFCLQFLSAASFKLTVSPLSIYLNQARKQKDAEAIHTFCDVARKTAAFCAIWRSYFDNTNSIDDIIREIIQRPPKGHPMKLCDFYYGNNDTRGREALGAEELGQHFIQILKDKQIKNLEEWLSKVTNKPIIKQVARFILLVGSHKMGFETEGSKKLTRLRDGPVLITRNGFHDRRVRSVEHIIPMNEREQGNNLYEDAAKNQLWNLTLVPSEVNKILSNRTWSYKQIFYQYYSARTEQEQEKCLAKLESKDREADKLKLFKQRVDPGHLPMIKYLANLDTKDFTKKDGESITEDIVRNCWRKLAVKWLGW